MACLARWPSIVTALLLASCAREEMPPGTGPDFQAPTVVETVPENGSAVPGFDDDAYIRFDEPVGDPRSLGRVVQTSPAWAYEISAGRRDVKIRPRGGWKANVVYTFRIPPGLRDLVRNQTREPIELSFSTGEEFWETRTSGVVWDRETVRRLRDIAVHVIGGDSVPYAAVSDTGGNFALSGLQPGDYWAFAFRDQNQNRMLDRRFEPHDSGLVSLPDPTSTVRLDLWLTTPDSTAPVLASARFTDSLNVRLEFDDLLDPDARLDSAAVGVTAEGTGEVWPVAEFAVGDLATVDSMAAPEAETDSIGEASGTPERVRPQRHVSVRLERAVAAGSYDLVARGFLNLRGLSGGGDTTLVYEAPAARPEEEETDPDMEVPDGEGREEEGT